MRMNKKHSKEEIFNHIKDIFVNSFEVDEALITPEALLYQDLGLDSIDAIDLIAVIQKETGKSLQIEALQKVRSIEDVIALIETLEASN